MEKENVTPNMGETWIHLKSGKPYKVLRMCRLRINPDKYKFPNSQKWGIGVAYMDEPSTDLFVRECFDDFMENFVRQQNYEA